MSDKDSVSSLGLAQINETLRRRRGEGQPSCMTWLVPLLVVVGVGLLIYMMYSYSCNSSAYNKNNGNANNGNGVLIVSNMSNNEARVLTDIDGPKLDALSSKQPIVVAFVAQGCGHCTRLKPNLVEAAKNSSKPLYTLHAHSKEGMERCKHFGVKGFPTILYIHKGRIIAEYNGDRSPGHIVNWVQSLQ